MTSSSTILIFVALCGSASGVSQELSSAVRVRVRSSLRGGLVTAPFGPYEGEQCKNGDDTLCTGGRHCGRWNDAPDAYQCCENWAVKDGQAWCQVANGEACSQGMNDNCVYPAACAKYQGGGDSFKCCNLYQPSGDGFAYCNPPPPPPEPKLATFYWRKLQTSGADTYEVTLTDMTSTTLTTGETTTQQWKDAQTTNLDAGFSLGGFKLGGSVSDSATNSVSVDNSVVSAATRAETTSEKVTVHPCDGASFQWAARLTFKSSNDMTTLLFPNIMCIKASCSNEIPKCAYTHCSDGDGILGIGNEPGCCNSCK